MRKNHTNMHFLENSGSQVCVSRNLTLQLTFLYKSESFKNLTDTLIDEIQPVVSENSRFVPRKQSVHSQISVLSVHDFCDGKIFCGIIFKERCSALGKLPIEITMEKNEKVAWKGFEFFYQENSYNYAITDKLRISCFQPDEANKVSGNRALFLSKRTSIETLIEENEPVTLMKVWYGIREKVFYALLPKSIQICSQGGRRKRH